MFHTLLPLGAAPRSRGNPCLPVSSLRCACLGSPDVPASSTILILPFPCPRPCFPHTHTPSFPRSRYLIASSVIASPISPLLAGEARNCYFRLSLKDTFFFLLACFIVSLDVLLDKRRGKKKGAAPSRYPNLITTRHPARRPIRHSLADTSRRGTGYPNIRSRQQRFLTGLLTGQRALLTPEGRINPTVPPRPGINHGQDGSPETLGRACHVPPPAGPGGGHRPYHHEGR